MQPHSHAEIDTRITRVSVPDQVFASVCEAILTGRYAPGERLPAQRELAREYGVNLTTVREAVKRLEQLKLVDVRHGSAMRVRDWRRHGSLDLIAHALLRAGHLDREMLEQVLEARRVLLSQSAALAAGRATPGQAERLTELAVRVAGEPDGAIAQQLDFAFYEELVEIAGNIVFSLIMNSVRDLYLAGAALYRGVIANRDRLAPLYAEISDAVAAGDSERARAAAYELAFTQERQLLDAFK